MTASHDLIFLHVARTLPDSLTARRELLLAVVRVLPAGHSAQGPIAAMLSAIALQEELQSRLPLEFTQGGKTQ